MDFLSLIPIADEKLMIPVCARSGVSAKIRAGAMMG